MRNPALVILLAVLSCTGCRTFTSPARGHELKDGEVYWFDYDATRRGGFLVPSSETVRVIAEPAPDVAMETVAEFLAKVKVEELEAEASAKISEKLIELGKRTETIMFLRESLYRLSEMGINAGLSKEEMVELYREVIGTWRQIAEADRIKMEAEKERFKAERLRQENYKSVLEKSQEGGGLDLDTILEGLEAPKDPK